MRSALLLLLLCAAPLRAQTRALIVSGVAGDARLGQEFQRDATALRDALVQRFGAAALLLTESSTPRSDRDGIAAGLSRLANEAKSGDNVLVVFIGHGSAQGETRINIPGPDITAAELSVMLEQLGSRPITLVLATSASGAMLPALKAPNRTILTATRSGGENEQVVFSRYFAEALSKDVADSDKDGGLSMAEAFEYAKREVTRFYQQQNRLPTEHALLSDTSGAQRFVLRGAATAPANAELAAIQQRIDALKARKSSMSAASYDAELEKLLLELARKTRELKASARSQ